YLSIGDLTQHLTTCSDQQAFADDEFALEAATHIGVFRRSSSVKNAGLGDNHMLAFLQSGLDRALDNKAVTGIDLASQSAHLPDNQRSPVNFVRPSASSPLGGDLQHS